MPARWTGGQETEALRQASCCRPWHQLFAFLLCLQMGGDRGGSQAQSSGSQPRPAVSQPQTAGSSASASTGLAATTGWRAGAPVSRRLLGQSCRGAASIRHSAASLGQLSGHYDPLAGATGALQPQFSMSGVAGAPAATAERRPPAFSASVTSGYSAAGHGAPVHWCVHHSHSCIMFEWQRQQQSLVLPQTCGAATEVGRGWTEEGVLWGQVSNPAFRIYACTILMSLCRWRVHTGGGRRLRSRPLNPASQPSLQHS